MDYDFFTILALVQNSRKMNARTLGLLSLNFLTVLTLNAQCDLPGGWSPTVYGVGATFSGLSSVTGGDVQINTPFDVDDDVDLSGCDVGIRGSSYIYVKSGSTLTISSNTLITDATGSGYWSGIIVEDGGFLEIKSGSTICHANVGVAIQINTAGDVTIDGANFIENRIAVSVGPYNGGIHPATIIGTTIDGGYPTTLPTGLVDTYGHTGININDVHDGGTPTGLARKFRTQFQVKPRA